MRELFESPKEMFDFINPFKDFLVSLRIKVLGAPYSCKYINPKYEVYNHKIVLSASNLEGSLEIPTNLIEEIKIRWEMLGNRQGQRMTVNCKHFQKMLPPDILDSIKDYVSALENSNLPPT